MKEYTIKPTKGFLPPIEYWIFDDLKISKIETAMLYKIILKNNPLTWNSAYIGKILHLSKSTVMRIVDDLCKKNVIEKRKKVYGSRLRWVLVAKYNSNGKISQEEINNLFDEGFKKLSKNLEKRYYKRKKK